MKKKLIECIYDKKYIEDLEVGDIVKVYELISDKHFSGHNRCINDRIEEDSENYIYGKVKYCTYDYAKIDYIQYSGNTRLRDEDDWEYCGDVSI